MFSGFWRLFRVVKVVPVESETLDHVRAELARVNFSQDDKDAIIHTIEVCVTRWGDSYWRIAPIMARLFNDLPLSPLTGEDSEWEENSKWPGYYTNKRCESVIKDPTGYVCDGSVYDVNVSRKPTITFPYTPPGY